MPTEENGYRGLGMRQRSLDLWPLLVIAALGINLRPILTSAGPLIEEIRSATGLGLQGASLLTVIPMLCMGLFALLLPWLSRYIREDQGMVSGLLAISLGCLWRLQLEGASMLIASAILTGSGVAIIQALAPGVIKRWYPRHVPLAMGIYSAALMGGGGVAALVSPLVSDHFHHWQAGLGIWLVPALLTLPLWWRARPRDTPTHARPSTAPNFFRSRRAWLLAAYFGLANGGYASMIAWLPMYSQQLGWSTRESGGLIGIMTLFQVLAALSLPLISSGQADRRPGLILALCLQLVGFCGLLLFPGPLMTLWVALIGFGLGSCFALSLTLTVDHLATPKLAGLLAAFVQGIGFIITAIMPYLTGLLREVSGSFAASWVLTLTTLLLMLGVTRYFSPTGYSQAMGVITPSGNESKSVLTGRVPSTR